MLVTADSDCSHKIKICLLLGKKAMTNIDSTLKSRDVTWLTKVKAVVFPVVMYRCESWTIKKAEHQRIDAFESWCLRKTLESPLEYKEIKPANPKDKSTLNIHWRDWCWSWNSNTLPPDVKSQFTGKDLDAGKYWGQEEKGTTEDEMVGWHHRLNGHEFAQALGDSEGQGNMVCCSPWCHKDLDTAWQLNNEQQQQQC